MNDVSGIDVAMSTEQASVAGWTALVQSGAALATNLPANNAVWLPGKRADLEIAPAPYTRPGDNEIVVRNRAVAINPLDWLTQSMGDIFTPWTKYPFILGSDVAGEVAEVGHAVTGLKVGDRVLGHAIGSDKKRNSAAEGAFQDYTVLLAHMASPIPGAMAFENAAVLPLALSTAACGLFQKDQLALRHPSAHPQPVGKILIVWGGSTSVGSNAIQLAVAAGYEVLTTASPANFDYVRKLGATQVFDYRSRTAVRDIIKALKGRTIAGALAVGVGSGKACVAIVGACDGDKVVAMATPPVSFETVPRSRGRAMRLVPLFTRMMASMMSMTLKARVKGIRAKFIWGTSLFENEVGPMIYAGFLPAALAEGRYVAAPAPVVVGRGLDQIPAAMEDHRKGVSAKKLVVVL